MKEAKLPKNENERLQALKELEILDTLEEQAYDDLTKLAALICDVPIALVSLVDKERQWFKSNYGLAAKETDRSLAFCAHAILDDDIFYIPDSEKDDRFKDNPLVKGEPHVKFYAGIPLKVNGMFNVGTLCVIDNKPNQLSQIQKDALKILGRQVESQFMLRKLNKEQTFALRNANEEIRNKIMMDRTQKAAKIGSWRVNLKDQSIYWSKTTYDIHEEDYDKEIILEDAINYYVEEYRPIISKMIEDGIKEQKGWNADLKIRKKSGQEKWVRAIGHPVIDNGEVVQLEGTFQDIDDIIHYQDRLKEEKEKAVVAERSKSQFLANMSHEIRTPLNGILGMTEILTDKITDVESKEYLKIIQNCGKSLLVLINDVLDFSKIEAGKLDLEFREFNVHELIEECILLFKVSTDKNINLKFEFEPDTPKWIKSDPIRIKQILDNYLSNAVKFTKQGDIKVYLSHEYSNDERKLLKFSVKDSGIGISHENQQKLFKRFSQVDASDTRLYGGTGLGLSISKKLAVLLGGDVSVTSELGSGSEFNFTISYENINSSSPQIMALENKNTEFEKINILLVEDNIVNQKVASNFLKKLGMDIQVANNGNEAIDLVESNHFDLVFMDCQMPELDGFEATRKIKRTLGKDAPLIIALTASSMKEDIERCFSAGMDDFLSKPLSLNSLIEVLNKYDFSKK